MPGATVKGLVWCAFLFFAKIKKSYLLSSQLPATLLTRTTISSGNTLWDLPSYKDTRSHMRGTETNMTPLKPYKTKPATSATPELDALGLLATRWLRFSRAYTGSLQITISSKSPQTTPPSRTSPPSRHHWRLLTSKTAYFWNDTLTHFPPVKKSVRPPGQPRWFGGDQPHQNASFSCRAVKNSLLTVNKLVYQSIELYLRVTRGPSPNHSSIFHGRRGQRASDLLAPSSLPFCCATPFSHFQKSVVYRAGGTKPSRGISQVYLAAPNSNYLGSDLLKRIGRAQEYRERLGYGIIYIRGYSLLG